MYKNQKAKEEAVLTMSHLDLKACPLFLSFRLFSLAPTIKKGIKKQIWAFFSNTFRLGRSKADESVQWSKNNVNKLVTWGSETYHQMRSQGGILQVDISG